MTELSIEEQVKLLMHGSEFGDDSLKAAMAKELKERLEGSQKEGKPLRVYAGYDPSRPDIHLGHSITMRKLRQFQELGHDVIFVVGTFTAQVGDTSDKNTARPTRTMDEVMDAASTYAEQCYRILDRDKTTVVYNADWLSELTMADVVRLASNFTVQQFLTRDNYRKRIERSDAVGLHEFLYALLQGYDAVHLRADVQLGATEQLFNIMAGRKLQEVHGQKGNVMLTFPILVGLDGTERMSKSKGNYVGIAEAPNEQFGKTMSISDDTMLQWIDLVTRWTPDEIEARIAGLRSGETHPMQLKKDLAREIVSMYHGDEAAERAAQHFESVHQAKQVPDEMPECVLAGPAGLIDLLVEQGLASSKSEARRLIKGGGVRIDQQPVSDFDRQVAASCLIQVGKRRFLRVFVEG